MNDPELEKEMTRIKGEIDHIHNTKLDYWKNRCEDSSKRIKHLNNALQTVREDRNNLIQADQGQCQMINDLRYELRVGKQTQQDLQSEITQLTKRNETQAECIKGYQKDRLSHYSKLQSEITQLTKRNETQAECIKGYQKDRLSPDDRSYGKLISKNSKLTMINAKQGQRINELIKVITETGNNLGYIREDIHQRLNTPKG